MAAPWAKAFYNSDAWQTFRAAYILTVYGLCEKCGEAGLILHHKIRLTASNINNPEITLNTEHVEYLCEKCHNEITFRKTGRRYSFDEFGNIV